MTPDTDAAPLLRDDHSRQRNVIGLVLVLVTGALAAVLVVCGNPGNMGICGACFLRDVAGAVGWITSPAPKLDPRFSYFRPEVAGVMLGALGIALLRRRFVARSGSHAASRFILGVLMAIAALVFLGCPFRMLQRLGGGDLNALAGLAGFIVGVFAGLSFERRGYSIGKTSPAPAPVGLQAHVAVHVLLALFIAGGVLSGPGAGQSGVPAHAYWAVSLGIALVAGALLSLTGFCAVSGARQIFQRRRTMLVATLCLIAGYAIVMIAAGRFHPGFDGQPIAHTDGFWNFASMVLVGLTGALAGGCPVRQMTMAGEGNGDAFVTVLGLIAGGALAHNLALASSPAGPTAGGKVAIAIGLVWAAAYAVSIVRSSHPQQT